MGEEQSVDLRELLDIILINIKTIGKITLGFIVLAALYLIIASPVYESTALLRVKQQQGLGDSLLNAAVGGNTQLTQQRMSTYAEILKSRSVVVPVLLSFPNVVITSHQAFFTRTALQSIAITTMENARAFARGEKLVNLVE